MRPRVKILIAAWFMCAFLFAGALGLTAYQAIMESPEASACSQEQSDSPYPAYNIEPTTTIEAKP